MPTPTTGSTAGSVALSANTQINALLSESRWGAGGGAALSYSFPGYGSSWSTGYGEGEPFRSTFRPLTTTQQNAFREALQGWSNVANITFTETSDTPTTVGDIRVAFTRLSSEASAWAYYPAASPEGGDVWLNTIYSYNTTPTVGSYGYMTLIHELGHALGLKHSFEDATVMPSAQENRRYTVMSYTEAANSDVEPSTPMLLDILAIQYIYGANTSYHTGNDSYTISTTTEVMETLWDAGGDDTLNASNQSLGASLDLRDGYYSSIGVRNGGGAAVGNVAIAYGTLIENAIGGTDNDTIRGNYAANRLSGGAGNDIFYTAGGNDSVYGEGGNDVLYLESPDGIVQATGVETIVGSAGFDVVFIIDTASVLSGSVDAAIGGSGADAILLTGGSNRLWAAALDTVVGGSGYDFIDLGNRGSTSLVSGLEVLMGSLNTDVITLTGDSNRLWAAAIETLAGGSGYDFIDLGNRGSTTTVSGLEVLMGSLNTDVITLAGTGSRLWIAAVETLAGSVGFDHIDLGNRGSTTTVLGIETITGSANTDVIALGTATPTLLVSGVETLTGSSGNDVVGVIQGGVRFTGGLGAEILTLGTGNGADAILYTSIDDGAAAGQTTGYDQIIGFQNGSDTVVIGGALRSLIDRNASGTLDTATRAGGSINTATDELAILSGGVAALADDGLASARTAIGALTTGGTAANLLVLATSTDQSGLYLVQDNGDGAIAAAEIRLLVTVRGTLTGNDLLLG